MKKLFIGLFIPVILVALVYFTGFFLPKSHTAEGDIVINAPIDSVWDALVNVDGYIDWRDDLKDLERVDEDTWVEVGPKDDRLTFSITEQTKPNKLVVIIDDDELPFGGEWVYTLEEQSADNTKLIITENGEVYNPLFRFMSYFFLDPTASLTAFQEDLNRHLTE